MVNPCMILFSVVLLSVFLYASENKIIHPISVRLKAPHQVDGVFQVVYDDSLIAEDDTVSSNSGDETESKEDKKVNDQQEPRNDEKEESSLEKDIGEVVSVEVENQSKLSDVNDMSHQQHGYESSSVTENTRFKSVSEEQPKVEVKEERQRGEDDVDNRDKEEKNSDGQEKPSDEENNDDVEEEKELKENIDNNQPKESKSENDHQIIDMQPELPVTKSPKNKTDSYARIRRYMKPSDYVEFSSSETLKRQQSLKDHGLLSKDIPTITLVSIMTINRSEFLKLLISMWKGNMSICVGLVSEEEYEVKWNEVFSFDIPSRVVLTPVFYKRNQEFPVNKMRNAAIGAVTTTHFFYNDIDFLPSDDLFGRLMALPESFLLKPQLAIVVPAFELFPKLKVGKNEFSHKLKELINYLPHDRQMLRDSLNEGTITVFREKSGLHDYLLSEWFDTSMTFDVYRIPCFVGDRQEPYVVVQKSSSLPMYDERFVGYGFNKVQWLEHLRASGYEFFVFRHGFIVHFPHPASESLSRFPVRVKSVGELYKKFLNELHRKYPRSKTPKCN